MLQARGLAVEVGGTVLVEGVSFTVRDREKVGLVGRNGAGKTTLLQVLGGHARPTAGVVSRTGGVGYLPQDPRIHGAPDLTLALSYVLSGRELDEAVVRLEKLRLRIEELPSPDNVARYARAEDAFRHAGGYAAEAEVRQLASGLGLGGDRLDLPIGVLSGGERRRVELARILFAGSDVLLLDEPTNHLDNDARDWLLRFLRGYRGALVVVSHDIELLDDAITRVLHLDRPADDTVGVLFEYKGTYSQYLVARRLDEARQARLAARQQAEIRRLSSLADSMRHQTEKRARTAKTLDSRVRRLRAEAVDAPRAKRALRLRLPKPPAPGRTVLTVEGMAKSYGALEVFRDVRFDVERGERLLIMGLNGAGKTSLLRILAGVSTADTGTLTFGHNVSVGYYAQEHEGIVAGRTVLDHVREQAPTMADVEARRLLGMFGLTGERAYQDAGTLSGGEKTKLALSLLVAGRHNLVLLDEPTNNLDPDARAATAAALDAWTGTIVLVSHDTPFVRDLEPDRVLFMPEGNTDYWRDELADLVELA
ncbi:MAG: ABC-F family ATP-binding cassette domain-containing protein [Acidimicrobiales bacterium]